MRIFFINAGLYLKLLVELNVARDKNGGSKYPRKLLNAFVSSLSLCKQYLRLRIDILLLLLSRMVYARVKKTIKIELFLLSRMVYLSVIYIRHNKARIFRKSIHF